MPLTPDDVRMKLFRRQLRGYAMQEVDDFLDEVAAELVRLGAVISDLEARLRGDGSGARP